MKYLPITNSQFTILNALLVGLLMSPIIMNYEFTYTLAAVPASNAITADITDTLKSVTQNVSSSITDTIDKVIADSLDGMIEDTVNLLVKNTTHQGDNLSDVKFDPKIPSGIDIS